MDENTMEKKMKLVQQIRSQYHQNQYDLSNREQILYGRTSGKPRLLSYENDYNKNDYQDNHFRGENPSISNHEASTAKESLKFRSIMAIMLLFFAILFDLFGVTPAGIEMQQVFEIIAADYRENMTAFVDAMTEENILE